MSRLQRWLLVVAVALVLLGLAVAALPKEWIEETFGFEPDQGNGLVELALAVVPIAAGVALGAVVLVTRYRTADPRSAT